MKSGAGNIFTPFDMAASPLSGVHLIEAGAGTGKTYALTALFIRLLVEKKLTTGEILVVTFTNAATKELRGRIRQKVREAIEAFAGADTRDAFLQELVKTHEAAEALRLLGDALRDFDLASIFTIHGFCQRMLREHAFESGAAFDSELLSDDSELRDEVLDDFWRTRFYPADMDFFRYATSRKVNLKLLGKLLAEGTAQPQISIVPETGPVELPDRAPVREMFRGLQRAWPAAGEAVLDSLSSPVLNKNKYRSPAKIAAGMEAYLSEGTVFPLPGDFEKFTPGYMGASVKKGGECPSHPFLESCGDFYRAAAAVEAQMDRKILSLKGDMFRYFREEFARRKQGLNVQSFEDLLTRVKNALEGRGGKILAAAVRARYKAALVDEFQDTDPVQYSIFSRIFSESGALFLIGDPKQSIYGFRGADLFTYIKASAEVEDRHTLLTNRRSEPPMIDAVNAVFARARHPFLFEGIEFRDAQSEPNENLKPLTFKGSQGPPFHIWLVPDEGRSVPKGWAKNAIARAIAAEAARLVKLGREGRCLLGDKPLREGDIAVLVRKNSEAPIIQRALREKGIISVLCSDADVFVSEEALDLELVLRAVAQPASESAFRAALATDLIGLAAESLEALLADGAGREDRRARFRAWRERWERSGFLVMFRQILNDEKVRERMLGLPDGERRLTNYLHLGELLHRETAERLPGIAALVDWLSLRRSEELRQAPEERQLRLESESDAVRVMTIHMSKGLEFPVVFCPFNWDGGMGKKKEHLLYHDRKDNWKLNLALVSPGPEAEAQARMEALAENIRLMYVSMTRAKNRCYFVWGRIKDSFTSAPAYILHPIGGAGDPEAIVDDIKQHLKDISFREMRAEIESLQKKSNGAISVSILTAAAGPQLPAPVKGTDEPVLREFKSPVERDWKVSSFSSLAATRRALPELPDHDGGQDDYEPRPDRKTITDFPRGSHAGNFFHGLFEEMDFSDTGGIEGLTSRKLGEHGYGGEWTETVSAMARNVLAADLDGRGLKLAALPRSQRLTELGFYIPLNRISPASLAGVFRRSPGGPGGCPASFPERLGSLEFDPCRGFMRGFIDLVFASAGRFYLVDWKSNFLGHSPGDYEGAKLAASMEEHLYNLQYHLYCLALHKYLRLRVPGYSYDRHFGGVFYIYLRGFGEPGRGGIFRDRPPEGLIGALEKELVRIDAEGGRA
jgi:exodeoxyribonuclease V beta subunit